ncbi:MAG: carbohydrate ABC transporter permease [Clostridia bacterium]|nr:carbohydrate ABC transporter permease [Clostridia bacterium]
MATIARHKNRIKDSKGTKVVMWIAFAIFVVYGIMLLFPLLWCFFNSFKTRQEFIDSVWAMPKYWFVENWIECFKMEYNEVNLLGMFGNTIIFTVGCTVVSTFFSAATAYVLTKYPFPGSKRFYSLAFILMMIPMVGNTASVYKLYFDLHLYNTYWGPIISSCGGFGMGFVLLYGFFKNISWTYAEAAFIDGANHFLVFFKIMLPMALPAISAIAISGAIGIWNEYYTFYMYTPDKVTVALGLYGLQSANSYGKISYPQLFAAMMISTIPVIVIYGCAQKFIIKNTTLGGIKG